MMVFLVFYVMGHHAVRVVTVARTRDAGVPSLAEPPNAGKALQVLFKVQVVSLSLRPTTMAT